MRTLKILLYVIAALLAWKIVRTDWRVVAPYWFHDSDPPASDWYGPYPVPLPISPFWRPPKPDEVHPTVTTRWRDPARDPTPYKDWKGFFPAGGAAGITGPPRLQPNWALIALKLGGALIVVFPTVVFVDYLWRRFSKRASVLGLRHA